mmetsp:Transcript_27505/g.58100  ORF Transcript_27505/g.58100 Transcript_27505/m.58100 type:complete len:158 (-) Transcript_27505:375-848(-)
MRPRLLHCLPLLPPILIQSPWWWWNEWLLVLASGSVFDVLVLSNQVVVDLCYVYRSNPTKAAEATIEQSNEEWLLNDDCCEDVANYNDMTCVIIYFHHAGVNGEDYINPTKNQTERFAPMDCCATICHQCYLDNNLWETSWQRVDLEEIDQPPQHAN